MLISEMISNKTKVNQFAKKGIETVNDLLSFSPRKYYDFSKVCDPSVLRDGDMAVIHGYIYASERKTSSTGKEMVVATLRCALNNYYVNLIYFNQTFMINKLTEGSYITVCGAVSVRMREVTMINPILTIQSEPDNPCLPGYYPVYSKVQGMSDEYLKNSISQALELLEDRQEYLPEDVMNKLGLISHNKALHKIHNPCSKKDVALAKKRMVFDDLVYYNSLLYDQAQARSAKASWKFGVSQLAKKYVQNLPYELTFDQKNVLTKIIRNGQAGINQKVLVIGDVGYGKTEVVKVASLYAVEQKKQVVVMAPTQILATQHFIDFQNSLEDLGVRVALLHSGLKKKERKELLSELAQGDVDVLIGTHALISDDVIFKDLGMVVIDEEHRFGVNVRDKLAIQYPDIYHISMSATPIPRTLALGLYGLSTEVLTIKTAPANRKPVKTIWGNYGSEKDAVLKTLQKKHQVYVVCPSIEDNEETELRSVEQVFEEYQNIYPQARVEILTGKTKTEDQDRLLQEFKQGLIDILISTTVIEVGVNVPNATLMIIQDANRFGLAQLHQLRGRVGRSNTIQEQAECWLLCSSAFSQAPARLQVLVDSNDGFYVAEKDLEERGSGDWCGTQQSGLNRYIDTIMRYPNMNSVAMKVVAQLNEKHPESLKIIEEMYN